MVKLNIHLCFACDNYKYNVECFTFKLDKLGNKLCQLTADRKLAQMLTITKG